MQNPRTPLGQLIPQDQYVAHCLEMTQHNKDLMKLAPPAEVEMFKRFMAISPKEIERELNHPDFQSRKNAGLALLKAHKRVLEKAGVTSALGYNFYDLRGPALMLFPVNVPFRNMLPRFGRVNDGYGVAAHWNATKNFGTQYAGVVEGQRNAQATPDFNAYIATYKELGIERALTFTSQFAGEGYTDNVADEHLRGMFELWLQEESLMLMGNSGTAAGNNGYALGVTPTPVAALTASTSGLGSGVNVSCFCVAISALGNPQNTQYGYGVFPTVATGLTGTYTRTNADGSTTPISCGSGIVSLASNVVTTNGSNEWVTFSVTPKAGSYAYAWYVNITDASSPSKNNAFLAAITTQPTFLCKANPTGTQTAAATVLATDYSFNQYDFDGLLTYAAATAGGYYVNGLGANLTKGVGGSVVELDTDLQSLWTNFQAQPTAIWASVDAKVAIENTILASTNGGNNFRFNLTAGSDQGNLLGGFTVSAYKSKFTMNAQGGDSLPIRIHPMFPPGTIYYDISENPYPHSRIPFVRGMLVQRDYYSIEWPLVSRQWTFGTYCHEVLAHYVPWISAVRTGIGGAGS